MVKDPVCQMDVDEQQAPGGKAFYWGQVSYFCSTNCRETFEKDPEKYVSTSEQNIDSATSFSRWT